MNEQESKARLIVKRIVARLANDDTQLGTEWRSISESRREGYVGELTTIAAEVLGEEEKQPLDPQKAISQLCNDRGYATVMGDVRDYAHERFTAHLTIGPMSSVLTGCECRTPGICEWCCGTGKVTRRVKQAKEEAGRPKEQEKPIEERPPKFWELEGVAYRLRSMGATMVEARPDMVRVEFEQGEPRPPSDAESGEGEKGCTP